MLLVQKLIYIMGGHKSFAMPMVEFSNTDESKSVGH